MNPLLYRQCYIQAIPPAQLLIYRALLVQCLRAVQSSCFQVAAFTLPWNLFVTVWSWCGHFSKSLFSLNLWLVVHWLAMLYRHLSMNVSPRREYKSFVGLVANFWRQDFLSARLWEYIGHYLSRNQNLLLGAIYGIRAAQNLNVLQVWINIRIHHPKIRLIKSTEKTFF